MPTPLHGISLWWADPPRLLVGDPDLQHAARHRLCLRLRWPPHGTCQQLSTLPWPSCVDFLYFYRPVHLILIESFKSLKILKAFQKSKFEYFPRCTSRTIPCPFRWSKQLTLKTRMEELFYYQEELCAESTNSFVLLRTSIAQDFPKDHNFGVLGNPRKCFCPSATCKLAPVPFLCQISCRSRGGVCGLKTLFFLYGPGFKG